MLPYHLPKLGLYIPKYHEYLTETKTKLLNAVQQHIGGKIPIIPWSHQILRLMGRNSIGCSHPYKAEQNTRPSSSGSFPLTLNQSEVDEEFKPTKHLNQTLWAEFGPSQANEACETVKSLRPTVIGTFLSSQSSGSESIDDLLDETRYFHFDYCPSSECGDVISANRYNRFQQHEFILVVYITSIGLTR